MNFIIWAVSFAAGVGIALGVVLVSLTFFVMTNFFEPDEALEKNALVYQADQETINEIQENCKTKALNNIELMEPSLAWYFGYWTAKCEMNEESD